MGKYSLLFSPPPSRQPPAIESNFISAFLRCHYVFRWYFTTRMNFFLSLQQYILLSTSHVLLKWHSRFLWRRQREILNLYARDTATASWTLRWGGSRWHREHGKRRNLREKLLQFFTRVCSLRSPDRRVVVKLNVPYVIWWRQKKIHKLPPTVRNLRILSHSTALSRHNTNMLRLWNMFWDHTSNLVGGSTISNLNNRVYITFTNYRRKSRSLERIMLVEKWERERKVYARK